MTVEAETIPAGQQASVEKTHPEGEPYNLKFYIPEGKQGETGNGISEITLISTSGLEKTYRITYTNGNYFDYTVTDGEQGETGQTGATGNGIQDIELISTVGLQKTYRINFTNGDHYDYVVTDGETPTIDPVPTEESNNAVSSGGTYTAIQDAVKNKADKNGNYEEMTVGTAEQLLASVYVEDKVPYNFRTSGGSADIGDREIDKIVGGTLKWNQLVGENDTSVTVPIEHKYFYRIVVSDIATNGIALSDGTAIAVTGGVDNINDLTLMFGTTIADYVYGLEIAEAGKGVEWFKKLFPKDYYEYDASSFQSVNVSAHNMVEFNQWDEQMKPGGLNNSDGAVNNSAALHSDFIHVLPNTKYYFGCSSKTDSEPWRQRICFYSSNNTASFINAIGSAYNTVNGIRTPTNCHYIRFSTNNDNYGTEYRNDITINIFWNGSHNGEYEPYVKHSYALDHSLILRGFPMLDTNNNLYYDGDEYEGSGLVTRKCGTRAYESGDENDSTVITDGTTTIYKLTTPTTEQAEPFANPQIVNDWGTEEYVDYGVEQGTRDVAIPVGHITQYPANLRDKLQHLPSLGNSGDGVYHIQQTGTQMTLVLDTTASRLNTLEADKQDKLSQSTDLSPTTQTVTLSKNTRYAFGTLTDLSITFPATTDDGDEIVIEFVSGSTATTLTLDNTNAIYNFDSVNANKFVELNAQYKVSIDKWVVRSAETDYSAV